MAETTRTPTLQEVIGNALDAYCKDMHVALPCSVQSYDVNTQTVDVQPVLQRPFVDAAGTEGVEPRPVISNVQVQFPTGGGMIFTFPLVVGDTGYLVFSDQSLDIWKATGAANVDPIDLRTHHITDAVFIPGVLPTSNPRKSASTQYMMLGKDGAAAEFVATSQRTLTQLQNMVTSFNNFITVFDAHTHNVTAVGSPTGPSLAPGTAASTPSAPASQTVKILD